MAWAPFCLSSLLEMDSSKPTSPEPSWGETPIADVISRLLLQRYQLPRSERVQADVNDEERFLSLRYYSGRSEYQIKVKYLRGAGPERDPWMLMADALDGLFGSLLESGRDYRSLPSGSEIGFQGAYFAVEVAHQIPELSRLADQILNPANN